MPKDYDRDEWARKLGYSFVVAPGSLYGGLPPRDLTPAQKAERELEDLRRDLRGAKEINESQARELRRIQQNGCVTGIVLSVRAETLVVAVGSQMAEVKKPDKLPLGQVIEEGCSVRLTQPSIAVVEVVEPIAIGTVHEVVRPLPGGLCEVKSVPQNRAVLCPSGLGVSQGDLVVVDGTMVCVLRNLGKAGSERLDAREATGVSWSDVVGQEEAVRAMREALEEPVTHRELYEELGKKRPRGVLLYGPPGTGKTMIGKAAATAVAELYSGSGGPEGFRYVKGPELATKWFGASEEAVRGLFSDARRFSAKHGYPQVVFLDEGESLLGSRAKKEGRGNADVNIVQAFLAEMDGLSDGGAFIIIATNRPQDIDPAVLRDGRIDAKVRVGRPTREAVEGIARAALGKTRTENGLELTSERAADVLFSPKFVLGMVTDSDGKRSRVTLTNAMSGALAAGTIEVAKQVAIRRVRGGSITRSVTYEDVAEAARVKFAEVLESGGALEPAVEVAGGPGKFASFERAKS